MTPEQAVAYVHSQSVAARIEMESMCALNKERECQSKALAYDEIAFLLIIDKYYNAVMETFINANS